MTTPPAPPPPPPPPPPPALPPGAGEPYGYRPPLGIDPVTGQVYSDRSKIAAGLLQLLLGGLLCVGGVGRLYAGQTELGVLQVVASVVAWISLVCLGWLIIGIFPFIAAWVWFIVDGIVILAGRPVDGQGRLLRP